MANDFKRFCVPNVGTSNTDLYTVPFYLLVLVHLLLKQSLLVLLWQINLLQV